MSIINVIKIIVSEWVSIYHTYLPVCKSIFYSLKIGPKNGPWLIHGSKTEIKKSSGPISHVTIAYLKENSKIKDKFFKSILTQKCIMKTPSGAWSYEEAQVKYQDYEAILLENQPGKVRWYHWPTSLHAWSQQIGMVANVIHGHEHLINLKGNML